MVASLKNVNIRSVIIRENAAPPPSYDYFLDTFTGSSDLSTHVADTGQVYYGDQSPATAVASGAFTVSGGSLIRDEVYTNGNTVSIIVASPPISDFFIEMYGVFNSAIVPPSTRESSAGIYVLNDYFGPFQGFSISLTYGFPTPSPDRYFIQMWENTPIGGAVTTYIDPATYTAGTEFTVRVNITNSGQTLEYFFNDVSIRNVTSDFPVFAQYWLEMIESFSVPMSNDVTVSTWRTGPLPYTP